MKVSRAILVLEDGCTYKGWSFSRPLTSVGEVVFNTGMTGYQEVMTDPSYSGQIINFTYPELGNTGINNEDDESKKPLISGIIAKNICLKPSNWRYTQSLVDYLQEKQIMHIYGIDTRELTKHLRKTGTIKGCISNKDLDRDSIFSNLRSISQLVNKNIAIEASTQRPYVLNKRSLYKPLYSTSRINKTNLKENFIIVVIDFGVKNNILRYLTKYINNNNIIILPANTAFETILEYNPDGILLSNGPGNPEDISDGVQMIQKILPYRIPIFGICMGHQILSLGLGLKVFKLKFGHRGLNHPVGFNKQVEITSQNHGFAIQEDQGQQNTNLLINQLNYNDHTIAAISHREYPCFAVQYHPEASPGPHDSENLFLHFIRIIKLAKKYPNLIKIKR
jgi:carbamoyl-phosphate synthase small subunit